MSNETARLAREWAESRNPNSLTGAAKAAREHIMATTDPLTMADVEWNDEKHYLAGAVDADGHEVVMLDKLHGNIRVCDVDQMGLGRPVLESPKTITPNGKRYELREIGAQEEPARPATLVTEQDYENAPVGTVVAEPGRPALTKTHGGEWHRYGGWFTSDEMAGTERQVLRWGKHEDTSEPTVSLDENVGPDQPEHPATLNTMVDYDSAPEGTIVLDGYEDPWVKRENLWCIRNLKVTSEDMARWNDLEVVRWGWGK